MAEQKYYDTLTQQEVTEDFIKAQYEELMSMGDYLHDTYENFKNNNYQEANTATAAYNKCKAELSVNLREFSELIDSESQEVIMNNEEVARWEQQQKTVTLTNRLCNTLQCYILMNEVQRREEIRSWEELAREKDENGARKFRNAIDNAQFLRGMEMQLQQILKALN